MSDTQAGAPETEGSGASESGPAADQFPITVNAQYVKDFSFEAPGLPKALSELTQPPGVDVKVDIKVRRMEDPTWDVELHIGGVAKNRSTDEVIFVVELVYSGLFTLNAVPEHAVRPVLLIECPRLLFPFARGLIATVTREAGVPPMLISPVDFHDLYRRHIEQSRNEAEPGEAGEAGPSGNGASAESPSA